MIKVQKYLPVGIMAKTELTGIAAGIIIAVLRSLFFFDTYYDCYGDLYEYFGDKSILITTRKMQDFHVVVKDCFDWFLIVIFMFIALAVFHYVYHYKDSKSIYTMKRLTQKTELYRRCFTLPLVSIGICIITVGVLFVIYYKFYMAFTPPECLTDGQLEKFIANIISTHWVTIF